MKNKGIRILLLFTWVMAGQYAFASWPIGKYHYILAPTYSVYSASNGWDAKGKYHITDVNTGVTSQTLGLYGAYGLSRRLDVIASVPYILQSARNGAYQTGTTGAGDAQFGFSFVLANIKYANFLSLYGGVIIPLYTNSKTKMLGLGNNGSTLKLSNSGNLSSKFFYNIEAGVAFYTGVDAPRQGLGDITIGLLADKRNQFSVGFGGVYSQSTDKTFSLNTSTARDFYFTKGSVSYGHSFSKHTNLYFTGFYTLTGRNTGQGYGVSVSLLVHLPIK